MLGTVYLRDNKIHLQYSKETIGNKDGVVYEVGHHLMDFLWFDVEKVDALYCKMIELSFDEGLIESGNVKEYEKRMYDWIDKAEEFSPYLHFYTQSFLKFIFDLYVNRFEAFQELLMYVSDHNSEASRNLYTALMYGDVENPMDEVEDLMQDDSVGRYDLPFEGTQEENREIFDLAKKVIISDILKRREEISKEIDFLTAANDKTKGLTPLQRLFLFDFERKHYTNTRLNIRFAPSKIVPKGIKKDDVLQYIVNNNVDIVEMYDVFFIDDLIKFELFKMFSETNFIVKKCKYCGHYFIPKGRTDTEYCDRVKKGETKECNIIGAINIYKAKVVDDKIFIAYNKAYKRNYSRFRNKKMSDTDFWNWSDIAREKRDECYEKMELVEEFLEWLKG